MRDYEWDTWTSVLGWPVNGIWKPYSDGTDVNTLDRTHNKPYEVAIGTDSNFVNLFRYPCLKPRGDIHGKCELHVLTVHVDL